MREWLFSFADVVTAAGLVLCVYLWLVYLRGKRERRRGRVIRTVLDD